MLRLNRYRVGGQILFGVVAWLGVACGPHSMRLAVPEARANDVAYVYDSLNRVVQATDNTTGQAIIYAYDGSGNITSQRTVSLTTVAISDFTPKSGSIGTVVRITGTGFNPVPASNVVMFNGATATVSSASVTQLVVTVPTGATTGPISVGAVTTTSSFTVVSSGTGVAPTISGFSPAVGAVGTPVTVTGTGFQTTASRNSLAFNQTWAAVSSATATSLVVSVPSGATSGKLTVATPFGQATSGADFVVPPTGYTSSTLGAPTRGAIGSSTNLSISVANTAGLMLFDGTRGALLTIGVSGDTIPSCTIKVFGPDGSLLVASAAITGNGQAVQLPVLPLDGTYAVVVDAGANTGSVSLAIVGPVTSALTKDGPAAPITLGTPGQSAALTFSGTQGDYISLDLTNVTVVSGTVTILTPSGAVLLSGTFDTTGASFGPQLPVSGTYTVQIRPMGAIAGSLTAALTTAAAPTLNLNSDTNIQVSGQSPVSRTFRATTGQYITFAIAEACGPFGGAMMTVIQPSGAVLNAGTLAPGPYGSAGCAFGGSGYTGLGVVNLGPLLIGGTYKVVVQQTGTTASGSMTLTLSSPVQDTLTIGNSSPSIGKAGRGLLETFSGTQGQYLSIGVSEACSGVAGANLTVLKPDGTVLSAGGLVSGIGTSGCASAVAYSGLGVVNIGPLPTTGTYTFLLQQVGASAGLPTGTGSLVVSLAAPIGGALTVGSNNSPNITVTGQGLQKTFSGSQGQYLSIGVRANCIGIAGANLAVLNPDGTVLNTGGLVNSYGVSGCAAGTAYSGLGVVNIGPLPTTGTYTFVLQQVGASAGLPTGKGSPTISLAAPIGGALTVGSATSPNINLAGQGLQKTFNGTQGQYLSVAVRETCYGIIGANLTVLKPDGTVLGTGNLNVAPGTSGCLSSNVYTGLGIVNIGPLPTTGTYTFLLQQVGAASGYPTGTGSPRVMLAAPKTGSLTINGTVNSSINQDGQSLLYSFSGTAGKLGSLTVSETCGGVFGASISVIQPSGDSIATGTLAASSNGCGLSPGVSFAGSVVIPIGALPVSGTYTVLVQQTGGPVTATGTGTVSQTLSLH